MVASGQVWQTRICGESWAEEKFLDIKEVIERVRS